MDYSRQLYGCIQGGISKVYIFFYEEYLDSEIVVENNILIDFPYNIIYDLNANNINFDFDGKDSNGVSFEEKVSFQVNKLTENDKFKELIAKDVRIILKDNNGKIRLSGLKNGLTGSYKETSGTNRGDFSGYSFSFSGQEEDSAPYLTDLSMFGIMQLEGLLVEDGQGNLIEDGNNNVITN